MGWGKIRKSITKPFKDLGHGWWNDVRYPVIGVAAGALTGGLLGAAGVFGGASAGAGGAAAGSAAAGAGAAAGAVSGTTLGAVGGGLLGGYMGLQMGNAHSAYKLQQEANAATEAEAKRLAAAQNMPVLPAAPQSTASTYSDEASLSDSRRRYSLQKTVNSYSLRGSLGRGVGKNYSLG